MTESVAMTEQPSQTAAITIPRSPLSRLLLPIALVVLALGAGLAAWSGLNFGPQTMLIGAIAGGVGALAALVGLIAGLRRRLPLSGWALVIGTLSIALGATMVFPDQRELAIISAALPVLCAALTLRPLHTAIVTVVSLASLWAVAYFAAAEPSTNQLIQWSLLSAFVLVISIFALVCSATLRAFDRQQTVGHESTTQLNKQLGEEQERVERAAQMLVQERDRLAAVLGAASDGVVLADSNGIILQANAAARQLLNEAFGGTLEGQALNQWSQENTGRLRVISNEREGERQRVVFEQQQGTRKPVIGLNQVPIRSSAGSVLGYVGVFHDKTTELEVEEMRSQLLDFLVQDMHDPLNSVLAAQDTLLAGDLGDGNERVLSTARRTTSRLVELTNTLMEMSRLHGDPNSLHRLANPLRPLIEGSIAQATPQAQQRAINLVLEYGADSGGLAFDADKMRRVMSHLLDNALRRSPAYSTVRVQVSNTGGNAQVRIADQGPSIPVELAGRIFDRFSKQVGEQRIGGVGLAYCKQVIEAHGGRIWVDSTPGKGSTFIFSMPSAA